MTRLVMQYILLITLVLADFSGLYAQSRRERKALKVWVKQEGKWGLINGLEKWIVEPKYAKCLSVINDLAIVTFQKDSTKAVGEMRQHAVINHKGQEILKFQAVRASFTDSFETILYSTPSGTGAMDTEGEILVEAVYDELHEDASNKHPFIAVKDKMLGLVNDEGEVMVPFEYEWIKGIHLNIFHVKSEGFYGLVSMKNEVLIDLSFDYILPFQVFDHLSTVNVYNLFVAAAADNYSLYKITSDSVNIIFDDNELLPLPFAVGQELALIPYKNSSRIGYVDHQGLFVLELDTIFVGLNFFRDEGGVERKRLEKSLPNSQFSKNGFALINRKGEELIPPVYPLMGIFANGLVYCQSLGKYGCLNQNGQVVIPFKYEEEIYFSRYGLATTSINNKKGVISKKGETIIPFEYQRIIITRGGNFYCEKDTSISFYNNKGVELLNSTFSETRIDKGLNKVFKYYVQ